MKHQFRITVLFFIFSFFSTGSFGGDSFELTSPNFKNKESIPMKHVFSGFGCSGENKSPELKWGSPPAGTKSLALTVYDPDAPTGSGWWHWTVFNIPVSARKLSLGEGFKTKTLAGAVQGRTDFGKSEYGGPCPPEGDKPHRYIFTLYALKESRLKLNNDSSGAMVSYTLNEKMITKTSLVGTFERKAKSSKN
jgi:Raf kinase inhibitor-like YbhB/YbcL family protein